MLQSSRGVDSRKKIQELIWTTLETVQLPIARWNLEETRRYKDGSPSQTINIGWLATSKCCPQLHSRHPSTTRSLHPECTAHHSNIGLENLQNLRIISQGETSWLKVTTSRHTNLQVFICPFPNIWIVLKSLLEFQSLLQCVKERTLFFEEPWRNGLLRMGLCTDC